MRIHLLHAPNTLDVHSDINERELALLVDLARRGLATSTILVRFEGRNRRLDVRDINVNATLPSTIFPRVSEYPPAA